MSIEYVHGDSVVHNLTPYSKFLYMIFVMIASYILWDIVSVAIYLAISLIIWQLAGIPDILQRFKFIFYAASATAGMLMVADALVFRYNTTPLFTLFNATFPFLGDRYYGTFYLEGLIFGGTSALKIILVVSAVPVLTLTTSIPELVVALDRMRVPYKFNFALATAFRFSPLILASFTNIQEAQRLRAHDIDKMNYFAKIRKAYVPIFTPSRSSLLRRSDELEIAIESRGFGAPVKRTFVQEVKMRAADYIFMAFMLIFMAYTIYATIVFGGLIPPELLPVWLRPWRWHGSQLETIGLIRTALGV